MSLSDLRLLVTDAVRDDAARITAEEQGRAIESAVATYSSDRPRTKVEDVVTTGANELPLPAAWETDYSDLRSLEYPVGDVPPTTIDPERAALYQKPSSTVIQLLDALNVGSTVRVTFTVRHTCTESADTIPAKDRAVVAGLAASFLCDQLAAFYANDSDSTIQADGVLNRQRATEYRTQAKRLREQYQLHLGLNEQQAQPAGAFVNWDAADSQGQDRLGHPRRYR